MKLQELSNAATEFVNHLNRLRKDVYTEASIHTSDVAFVNKFRDEMPFEGLSKKSGVYIFTDSEMNALYIGKAGADNFAAEIWGKFSTTTSEEGYFANSKMAKYAPERWAEMIRRGEVFIHAIEISPSSMTSLMEVYLQTLCVRIENALPPVNEQIG